MGVRHRRRMLLYEARAEAESLPVSSSDIVRSIRGRRWFFEAERESQKVKVKSIFSALNSTLDSEWVKKRTVCHSV